MTRNQLDDLKALLRRDTGREYTDVEAMEVGNNLLSLVQEFAVDDVDPTELN